MRVDADIPFAAPHAKLSTERDLVRAAQAGSSEAADALVRRHWRQAFRAALLIVGARDDAEDVAQESLISALNSIKRFNRNRPFEPWLKRIVVNKALDSARVADRRRRLQADAVEASRNSAAPAEAFIEDQDLVVAILDLPLEQRVVVVMRFALGYETNEIARVLGLARGTVGSRLRRGLDQLQSSYERTP